MPETVRVAERNPGSSAEARRLALLWRLPGHTRAHGPQQGLTIDGIVAAATAIADGAGPVAVTMRRVAERLGVTAMSLYTYVPTKADLLDLMLDQAYETMPRTAPPDGSWRSRLETIAWDNRSLFERHPWAATFALSRPPLGPGVMAKYEYELAVLEGLGLDDVEMDDALSFLLGFVQASARAAGDARAVARESVMSDREWWAANAALLSRVMDDQAFPVAARVGTAAGTSTGAAYSPDHAWRFGLDRVLDGLGVLIERRAISERVSPTADGETISGATGSAETAYTN